MAQITYENKVALNQNPNVQAINKVQDTDMNQIKEVVNENETKILLAVTDTEPAECSTGDMYYDTTDDLIYTATGTNTWGSTGVAPTENTIYVVYDTQTAYAYNGTTLVSIGGGTGSSDIVMVDPDTPTADTKLYIESMDLDGNYEVNTETYSTEETLTNKIWIDGKTIYRKVYTGTITSVSGLEIGSISNFGTLIHIEGYSDIGGYITSLFQYWTNDLKCVLQVGTTNGKVYLNAGSSFLNKDYTIIVEYTKTTN